MNENPKPRLRWFQFTLRSLFLVTFLACIGMSWIGVKIQKARRQKETVEEIKKLGGRVWYDYQLGVSPIQRAQPSGSQWLRKLLGDDFFTNVVEVQLNDTQVTDAGLKHLKGLTQLQALLLNHTQVTDAGLEHLKRLTQLQGLSLNSTHVTDAGLENLKGLTQLQYLWLNNTHVTDAGLEHLTGLTQLQLLNLFSTQVTDQGAKTLQQALPNCRIFH